MPKKLQVGIKGVITNRNKALILRCKSQLGPTSSYWDLPGGRIDGSETIGQTLHRELEEEVLNLNSYKVTRLLHAWRSPYDFKDGPGLLFIYYQVEAHLTEVELSPEHSEFLWITKPEVAKLAQDESTEFPLGNQEAILRALS